MKAAALICARGGSKGLPGKNIKPLNGKPLIVYAIEHAKSVNRIERVLVSTDSEEIAQVARDAGASVPFLRPAELARDDSPEWLVWRHALEFLTAGGNRPDALVSVPATAPLRKPVDIENCLDAFEEGGSDVVITMTEAHRSPYFNMVVQKPDQSVSLVIPPVSGITRRQDAPVVYDITTVAYVVSPDFLMSSPGIFSGRVRGVFVPRERALDIDTPFDFRIAECLIAGGSDAHGS